MPRVFDRLIAFDRAVAQADDAVGEFGGVRFVRHEDHGVSGVVQPVEDVHDLRAGNGIEIARRFVGKDDVRIVHERAGDGDALFLSAGKLGRLHIQFFLEADATARRPRSAFFGRRPDTSE